MAPTLSVSIENTWRGSILDTVHPIAKFVLSDQKSIPGLKSLGNECPVQLISGETVLVWCALTQDHKVRFSVGHRKTSLISLTTEGPFDIDVVLPDGKLYQFKFENNS